MKPNIYVLQGVGNRGKSTTLKKLFVRLVDVFGVDIIVSGANCDDVEKIRQEIKQEQKDRRAGTKVMVNNISVVVAINNIRIGIHSSGDWRQSIQDALDLFRKNQCDIGICASRTKGGCIDELKKVTDYEVLFVDKLSIEGKDAVKWDKFNDLIEELQDWQVEELLKKISSVIEVKHRFNQ